MSTYEQRARELLRDIGEPYEIKEWPDGGGCVTCDSRSVCQKCTRVAVIGTYLQAERQARDRAIEALLRQALTEHYRKHPTATINSAESAATLRWVAQQLGILIE